MRGRDRKAVTSGRGWRLAVLAAVVASVATACANVPPPAGAAPLRYRDPVFGSVSTTSNIAYGVADDQFGIPGQAQRGVQDRPVLGGVDVLAPEHRIDALRQP